MKGASPNSKPANQELPARLQELLSQSNETFEAALGAEAKNRAQHFLQGIKAYRAHPAQRDLPDAPVVWQQGTTLLRDYNAANTNAPVMLVIPSLINRYHILDLDTSASFLRTLAAEGWRPLLVDWDEPGEQEQKFALQDYIARLGAIAAWISSQTRSGFHLLGYCMGGLLALGLASLHAQHIKTLTLMATPWDFHKPDPAIGINLAKFFAEWEKSSGVVDRMPVDILQYLFAVLQPLQSLTKFIDFAGEDPAGAGARHFVLLEDWINDGVPLPVKVARECLLEWYGENRTAQGQWRAGGQVVDPRRLTMPSYVVVPGRDRIVPPECALPLAQLLPHATLHEPMTGHIGMMASRQASQQVWRPFLQWPMLHR